jgi:hypothetical protein
MLSCNIWSKPQWSVTVSAISAQYPSASQSSCLHRRGRRRKAVHRFSMTDWKRYAAAIADRAGTDLQAPVRLISLDSKFGFQSTFDCLLPDTYWGQI